MEKESMEGAGKEQRGRENWSRNSLSKTTNVQYVGTSKKFASLVQFVKNPTKSQYKGIEWKYKSGDETGRKRDRAKDSIKETGWDNDTPS